MLNNKQRLLCPNYLSLEMKKKLIKSYICSVALNESETWTLGENEERIVKSPEMQQLSVIQQRKEWLATIPDRKQPPNQKIKG
jgi:hypothetical protein